MKRTLPAIAALTALFVVSGLTLGSPSNAPAKVAKPEQRTIHLTADTAPAPAPQQVTPAPVPNLPPHCYADYVNKAIAFADRAERLANGDDLNEGISGDLKRQQYGDPKQPGETVERDAILANMNSQLAIALKGTPCTPNG